MLHSNMMYAIVLLALYCTYTSRLCAPCSKPVTAIRFKLYTV